MNVALRLLGMGQARAMLGNVLLVLIALISLALVLAPAAGAQAGLPIRYAATTRTIYIGENYRSRLPAQAPFVGFPSHPDAPKQAISVPALAQALTSLGHPDLLVHQGEGAWLLRSNLVVSSTARLEATSETITNLRLDSTPDRPLALTRLIANGGHLLIDGISVVSWDASASAVDTTIQDGRSYLLAQNGGRMDIIDAEIAYLGWASGEPSGLAWRKRGTPSDPTTGATGSIIRSDIHDNYFGQYSYEAYGLQVLNNQFHHNLYYGFDPHDYSMHFTVAWNRVFNNGKHGIIFSRGCEGNWIHHNEVFDNAEHGIMLDRGSNNNTISDNLVYNNSDGIAIFQSSNNLIEGNRLQNNRRGVRINATYDSDDRYDGLAIENIVVGNTIIDSLQYGVYLYERGDRTTIRDNLIVGSAHSGVYLRSGANMLSGNTIQKNGHGVTIIGGTYALPPPGGPAYVTPASQPGNGNTLVGNTLIDNSGYGIRALGSEARSNSWSQNRISANGAGGIGNLYGANQAVSPPQMMTWPDLLVSGSTLPAGRIEIFSDTGDQGMFYEGQTTAAADGSFQFRMHEPWKGQRITAITTDPAGNSSGFAIASSPFQQFLPLIASCQVACLPE